MEFLQDKKQFGKEMGIIILACIMYSVSADIITPIHIIPGSVLGISQLLYTLKGYPVGVVNLLINIPIMAICVARFGKKVLIYTILVVCGNSLLMDVLMPYMPDLSNGFLLKCIVAVIAGAFNGGACGLTMRVGGSVGGVSAVVRVVKSHFQGLNVTIMMFLTDAVIIGSGALLLGKISLLFYSLVFSVSASAFVDIGYTLGRTEIDKVD